MKRSSSAPWYLQEDIEEILVLLGVDAAADVKEDIFVANEATGRSPRSRYSAEILGLGYGGGSSDYRTPLRKVTPAAARHTQRNVEKRTGVSRLK